MKSLTPTSKFKLLEANELTTPGCCISCGNSSGQFIDFGYTVEFWGAAYFCVDTCFREAANTFEYYSPEQYNRVVSDLEFYIRENDNLQRQTSEMQRVLGIITDNLSSTNVSAADDDIDTDSSEVVVSAESDEPIEQSDEPTVVEPEPELTRPTDESRHSNIRNDDSLDDFFATTLDI